MNDNAGKRPLIIAFGTIAVLYALSFAPLQDYRILGVDLKPITAPFKYELAGFTPHAAPPIIAGQQVTPDASPVRLNPASVPVSALISTAASAQTFSMLQTIATATGTLLIDYGSTMNMFHAAMERYRFNVAGSSTVRIAYVGDSQIEGDVITRDLRMLLQSEYGGQGAGFMKIVAEDAQFRSDVLQTFSDDWTVETLNRDTKEDNFWIGPVFISDAESWVHYVLQDKRVSGLDCYLIYQGDGKPHSIRVKTNKAPEKITVLGPAKGMSMAKVHDHADADLKKIKITFADAGIRTYGVFLQDTAGIYVDNYALRGHGGLELARISPEIAAQMRQHAPYNLIILHFGVNVAYPAASGYRLYEKGISTVIGHMRSIFPDAGILVVSTTDRCVKDGESVVSDSCVADLMHAQQRAAERSGVAFFDLYSAMGGTGSMNEWVKKGYAVRDYTHISRRGGKQIAELIYGSLMEKRN